ncbi:hypothetical protein BAMA_16275 [Bacillus manliponensis]|uniref:HNH endonuclease n=1 Tax=Bacillus manliponensis TaxID=574376 RepID=A0A073JSL6_9BACI|nr:hypothetical protein [Bacillus manliponensis]KEK17247.1 hypothetical protein BAMA_16275 [Bacillus manliponensis]
MNDLSKLKLLIDWKHPAFHKQTVRNNISQHLWLKKIRVHMLKSYNYTCAICNCKVPVEKASRSLHVHEVEEYDLDNLVCHLKKLELLCVNCHNIHHFKRAKAVFTQEQMVRLIEHFLDVNNCEFEDFVRCYNAREKQDIELITARLDQDIVSHYHNGTFMYSVSKDVPFHDDIVAQLQKKGLLYEE